MGRVKNGRCIVVGFNGMSNSMATEEIEENVFESRPVAESAVEIGGFRSHGDKLDECRLLFSRGSDGGGLRAQ